MAMVDGMWKVGLPTILGLVSCDAESSPQLEWSRGSRWSERSFIIDVPMFNDETLS